MGILAHGKFPHALVSVEADPMSCLPADSCMSLSVHVRKAISGIFLCCSLYQYFLTLCV